MKKKIFSEVESAGHVVHHPHLRRHPVADAPAAIMGPFWINEFWAGVQNLCFQNLPNNRYISYILYMYPRQRYKKEIIYAKCIYFKDIFIRNSNRYLHILFFSMS